MKILAQLENRPPLFWALTGLAGVAALGSLDYLTGDQAALTFLYLIPIALFTWFISRGAGVAASFFCALLSLLADRVAAGAASQPVIPAWNSLAQLGIFLTVTGLVSALKKARSREKDLARTDSLTGAVNGRYFTELVRLESLRSLRNRQPFTIACLDLGNVKALNDRDGLSAGDQALATIVSQARETLRKADVVARLAGDEFAILLPETNQAAAQAAMTRLQANLLDEVTRHNWPITFSIGVLTCIKTTQPSDELIQRASEMMYWAKQHGMNSVQYSVYAS